MERNLFFLGLGAPAGVDISMDTNAGQNDAHELFHGRVVGARSGSPSLWGCVSISPEDEGPPWSWSPRHLARFPSPNPGQCRRRHSRDAVPVVAVPAVAATRRSWRRNAGLVLSFLCWQGTDNNLALVDSVEPDAPKLLPRLPEGSWADDRNNPNSLSHLHFDQVCVHARYGRSINSTFHLLRVILAASLYAQLAFNRKSVFSFFLFFQKKIN